MSETTQQTSLPQEAVAELQNILNTKAAIRSELSTAGIDIDANTPFADYPGKVAELARQAAVPEGFCKVVVHINPPEGGGSLPTDPGQLSALLQGAYVSVSVDGVSFPQTAQVDSLYNTSYTVNIPLSRVVDGKVWLVLGDSSYKADPAAVTLRPNAYTDVTLVTRMNTATTVAVGRVQIKADEGGDPSSVSYPIKRTYGAAGTQTFFGGWSHSGEWNDQSNMRISVWDVATEDSEPKERVISSGGVGATDRIDDLVGVIRDAKQVKVTVKGDTESVDNFFMQYPKLYVKSEDTTIDIPSFDENGNVAKTVQTKVHIDWMCDEKIDDTWHLHAAYIRYVRDETSDTYTPIELDHCYIARYPDNFKNLVVDGVTLLIATSQPDGSREVFATRDSHLSACKALNGAPITVYVNGASTGMPYAANSDMRRWSMITTAEVGLMQYVGYIMFGVDIQNALMGVCAGSNGSVNGCLDYVIAKGVLFGGPDTTDNTKQIMFMGIEGGFWSSQGCMVPDQTQFAQKFADGTTTYFTMGALDRLDYNPLMGDLASMPGYQRFGVPKDNEDDDSQPGYVTSGNMFIALDDREGFRDWNIPVSNAAKVKMCIDGVDAHWVGNVPATEGINGCMTAFGHYRGSGRSLGLWARSASLVLSFADGNAWRSRASLTLSPEAS